MAWYEMCKSKRRRGCDDYQSAEILSEKVVNTKSLSKYLEFIFPKHFIVFVSIEKVKPLQILTIQAVWIHSGYLT
jgi:hypothetical protein